MEFIIVSRPSFEYLLQWKINGPIFVPVPTGSGSTGPKQSMLQQSSTYSARLMWKSSSPSTSAPSYSRTSSARPGSWRSWCSSWTCRLRRLRSSKWRWRDCCANKEQEQRNRRFLERGRRSLLGRAHPRGLLRRTKSIKNKLPPQREMNNVRIPTAPPFWRQTPQIKKRKLLWITLQLLWPDHMKGQRLFFSANMAFSKWRCRLCRDLW